MSSEGGGGGFDIFNPWHILMVLIVFFVIWLATGRRHQEQTDKFIDTQNGQTYTTYDKSYAPDQGEVQVYTRYFE